MPVALVREQILEDDVIAETMDRDELEERLQLRLSEELERLLGDRGEALSQTCSASERGGMLYVTLRAECLEDIAVETRAE